MKASHIVRLEEELLALNDRMHKLDKFISSSAYDSLPKVEQKLLFDQTNAMQDYANILQDRLFYYEDLSK